MPEVFVQSNNNLLLIANGIDAMLRWDGVGAIIEAGVAGPVNAISVSGSGVGSITGTYFAFLRFVDEDNNFSNLSPVSASTTLANSGLVNYTNVGISSQNRVVRRQILRNTAGQTNTFYVDVDTTDLSSTSFSSGLTDTILQTNQAVPLLDRDGRALANRFGIPPNDRPFLAQHLGRMYAGGETPYAEGSCIVTFGSSTITGIATEWKNTFVNRFIYVGDAPRPYQITQVFESSQTIAISRPYLGSTNPYSDYSIRPAPALKNVIYFSESGLPEAWSPENAIEVFEDGDEITGLMSMSSFLYILKRKSVYRFTCQSSPLDDGFVFLSSRRGCINERSFVVVGTNAYLLDESGVHLFSGQESEDVSGPIGDIFANKNPNYRINWTVSRFFHAVHDNVMMTIRFFVCMGGDYLPQHALCLNYESGRWWVERYNCKMGSSFLGREGRFVETFRTQSGETLYLGSQSRRIFAFRRNPLDGIQINRGTNRGTVTSATLFTITDQDARFPDKSVVGSYISIVNGKGKYQTRLIESISGTTLTVTKPWTSIPDSTSTYQIGGIPYDFKSGKFQYANVETRNPRSIRMAFKPSSVPGDIINVRTFTDWDEDPVVYFSDLQTNLTYGVKYTKGSPDAVLQLDRNFGNIAIRSDGHREANLDSPRTMTFEMLGICSESGLSVRQIILEGVAGGGDNN
jgi:hypothetical protein